MHKKLNLVVAACNNNGIGINGQLPWRLKKDMEFFKKITTDTESPDKQNAVIMGRKTWFSIPEKFRPLKGRINIVLSRELKEVPEGVHIARSLPDALSLVETAELCDRVENVHIIGGSSVYKEAMTGPFPCRIYLTKVLKDFDCDTYLPEISDDKFQKIANPENVPVELQEEKDVKFRFEVYEKVGTQNTNGPTDLQNSHLNQPMKSLDTSFDTSDGPIKFDAVAAMCHGNRGIGYKMQLPWPSLNDCDHPRVLKVVPKFDEAMELINVMHQRKEVDSVWIMGGSSLYQESLRHPQLNLLYLTHVYTDFPSDSFFPKFEDVFTEIEDQPEKGIMYEDNGVKFEFKVYKKRSDCS